jgi:chorismate-pyruvate lyase
MTGPTLDDLYALFPDAARPTVEVISGDDMPEPYRRLLVHTHHMTVTVEAFYDHSVDVRVLKHVRHGETYARKILLTLRPTGQVVQFGLVRIDLSLLTPAVRDAILAEDTPLGRVLIEHNVLRRVQPTEYLRVTPDAAMAGWFGRPEPTYGRLGVLFTDGRPAIEVLEILTPIDPE